MKIRTTAGLMVILVIVVDVISAGCMEENISTSTLTPTSTIEPSLRHNFTYQNVIRNPEPRLKW